MSFFDDFFGDAKTATPECSYCGVTDGELIVTIRSNDGPTHWAHPECKAAREKELRSRVPDPLGHDHDRDTSVDGIE